MIIYLYDGTFDGLFTAIFDSYAYKETPDKIVEIELAPPLLSTVRNITTDAEKSLRVRRKVFSLLSEKGKTALKFAFRTNHENKATLIYNMVKNLLDTGRDEIENFANANFYKVYKLYEKVHRERHRFLGFVRFSLSESGIYYGKISPDNDIVDLLLPHFARRFKNLPFIIHDEKRDIFACHNGNKNEVFTLNGGGKYFEGINDEFNALFKKYYDTVNIKQRKNLKTMRNFMPVRYYKNLPEKNELL